MKALRPLLAAIAFVMVWNFPYLEALNNPNELVRVYMTAAIVDHGTFAIGYREKHGAGFHDRGSVYDRFGYVNDKALTCRAPDARPPDCEGTLYAAKAPGTSYVAVPFYWAVSRAYEALDKTPSKAALLFWLRLFTVVVPTILLLVGVARHLARTVASSYVRGATLVGLGMGSLLFTYAPVFAGHALSAVFLGAAWLLLARLGETSRPGWRALGAGALAAAAVATEYPSAIGAVVLGVWLLARRPRPSWVALFALGTLGPAFLLGLYHHVCFGAAWRTAYVTLENEQFVKDIAPGVMGVHTPTLEAFVGSFFVPYNGLFFYAPWLLLLLPAFASAALWRSGSVPRATLLCLAGLATLAAALWSPWGLLGIPLVAGAALALRRGAGSPPGLGLALTMVLAYALFISSHSLWRGGWTVGPRYIVMMAPFAALAVGLAADRWYARAPRLTATALGGLVLASVTIVVASAQVSQGYPPEYTNPLFDFAWPMIRDGYVYANLGNLLGLRGVASLAPLLLVVGLVAAWLAAGRWLPSLERRVVRRAPATLATLAVAAATLALFGLVSWPRWTEALFGGSKWQRAAWHAADQAPAARERKALEAARKAGRLGPESRARLAARLVVAGESGRAETLLRAPVEALRQRYEKRAGLVAATAVGALAPYGLFVWPEPWLLGP